MDVSENRGIGFQPVKTPQNRQAGSLSHVETRNSGAVLTGMVDPIGT